MHSTLRAASAALAACLLVLAAACGKGARVQRPGVGAGSTPVSFNTRPLTPGFQRYLSQYYPFTLDVPDAWKSEVQPVAAQYGDKQIALPGNVFTPPDGSGRITIFALPAGPDDLLDAFAGKLVQELRQSGATDLHGPEPATLAGMDARAVSFHGHTTSGQEIDGRQWYLVKAERAWVVSVTAPAGTLDSFLQAAKPALDTLAILG